IFGTIKSHDQPRGWVYRFELDRAHRPLGVTSGLVDSALRSVYGRPTPRGRRLSTRPSYSSAKTRWAAAVPSVKVVQDDGRPDGVVGVPPPGGLPRRHPRGR